MQRTLKSSMNVTQSAMCKFKWGIVFSVYIYICLGLFSISLSTGEIVRISIIQDIRRQQYEISIIISDIKDTCYIQQSYVYAFELYVHNRDSLSCFVNFNVTSGNWNRWHAFREFWCDKILPDILYNKASRVLTVRFRWRDAGVDNRSTRDILTEVITLILTSIVRKIIS